MEVLIHLVLQENDMGQKGDEEDPGIPEYLKGKERRDWIKQALGRPVVQPPASQVQGTPIKQNTGGFVNDAVYSGKPKHLQ